MNQRLSIGRLPPVCYSLSHTAACPSARCRHWKIRQQEPHCRSHERTYRESRWHIYFNVRMGDVTRGAIIQIDPFEAETEVPRSAGASIGSSGWFKTLVFTAPTYDVVKSVLLGG